MIALGDVATHAPLPRIHPTEPSQAECAVRDSKLQLLACSSQASPVVSTSAVVGGTGLVLVSALLRANRGRRRAKRGGNSISCIVRQNAVANTNDLVQDAEKCLLNNYGKRSMVFTRGEGHYLFDTDGKKFLDFTAGIAVNCLGHSDPGWAEAVSKQAHTLTHTSNLWLNPEQIRLGEKLTRLSFADKAFFCNSGTEANEAAIKFARKFHVAAGKPREGFIAFENAFHGRTMGALALTWKENYKAPFQPLMPSVSFLPFNSTAELQSVDETTCAVFVEPMQGEGGVVPGTTEFLTALRKRCDEVGALLVFDEVQCGLGRTGHLFANEISGVEPDIMTLAKPLAGGLPIGAVLMREKVAEAIAPGDHGSTFAGAPLVCAAANHTLDRVSQEAFLANVREMGERLRAGLRRLAEPLGLDVRGEGLLNGVVFEDAKACGAVQRAAQEQGLLVLTAGAGNVLRIAPALTVGAEEVDAALQLLEAAFEAASPVAA
mmetsp:Transcript_75026/g.219795  ORF Transcript_75026/g.219795 Transcript_75026/m.219795 type:complete len:490 (-) Transcript_75026:59-1528(-)